MKCEKCNIEMKKLNIQLLTNPPQEVYECPECKSTNNIFVKTIQEDCSKVDTILNIVENNNKLLKYKTSLPTLYSSFDEYGYDY
jgi:uncharacterized protein YlaI